jgi:hypothetical protein
MNWETRLSNSTMSPELFWSACRLGSAAPAMSQLPITLTETRLESQGLEVPDRGVTGLCDPNYFDIEASTAVRFKRGEQCIWRMR